jgi:nucleotide-binding universal stress UspA family protein
LYKNILVPVDGSAASLGGLAEAIRLAKLSGGVLRLVHVVDELVMVDPEVPIYYQAMLATLRENGQAVLKKAEAFVAGQAIPVEGVVLETMGGRAADLILEQSRQWPADVIVMGTHGRRGLRRLVLGSDAELVLRSSAVPVLMVRDNEESA